MNWNEQGGAAFPFAATDPSNVELQSSGMSLRDWFAGQNMAGMLAGSFGDVAKDDRITDKVWRDLFFAGLSQAAYECADAMLAARGKQ